LEPIVKPHLFLPISPRQASAKCLHVVCGLCRYFEDDDDDQKTLAELEYQPAPGSPTLDRMNAAAANQKEDDDSSSNSSDDPLESFMADIEASSSLSLYCVLNAIQPGKIYHLK